MTAWGLPRGPSRTRMALPAAAARYHQVKHFVLEQIAGGTLVPGARVPSENVLVRTLGVSRMTANRALRELAADGVLVRVAGVGTFVADARVHAHPLEV
ncbi:MAG: GntR family transcriptional regulator, partial [Gammaproteobacteria bacterium]|nr:GntR family transcriptional regulator [Gammaproteobacteria bacterium]